MKLAFCLFNYFPYGGLQRDFLRIARLCRDRGHEIHVYTMRWEGEKEPGFQIHLLKTQGLQNHTRAFQFAKQFAGVCEQFDLVIGFNKMPHLDIYYAADVCYQSRVRAERSALYRLLPRYRFWMQLEKAVFAPGNKTTIMLISPQQKPEYKYHYHTENERFHLLPPGIAKPDMADENAAIIRDKIRKANEMSDDDFLLLMVGSGFKTKGLDRSIRSLAALPTHLKMRCRLMVIGKDDPISFMRLAKRLKVSNRITFLGGRDDVPHFLLAADLLLHPSYHENTGTVLLEAMASGLPVLTVAACGYAHYIESAKAGEVLPVPFLQAAWNDRLEKMLLSLKQSCWQQNGIAYAKQADLYSMPEKVADLIEQRGRDESIFV